MRYDGDEQYYRDLKNYEVNEDYTISRSVEKPCYFNLRIYDLIEIGDLFNLKFLLDDEIGREKDGFRFSLRKFRAILKNIKYDDIIDVYYPRSEKPLVIASDDYYYCLAPLVVFEGELKIGDEWINV